MINEAVRGSIRVLPLADLGDCGSRKTPPPTCGAEGCCKATQKHKPFCPDHVFKNAYVSSVLERLARREKENQRAYDGEALGLHSSLAADMLYDLAVNGAQTLNRLSGNMGLGKAVCEPGASLYQLALALERTGRVAISWNKRKSMVLRLP